MELGLQEKVIIVTGGSSGIGASVVDKLSLICLLYTSDAADE